MVDRFSYPILEDIMDRSKIDEMIEELQLMVASKHPDQDILNHCEHIKKFYSALSTEDREYVDSIYTFYETSNNKG